MPFWTSSPGEPLIKSRPKNRRNWWASRKSRMTKLRSQVISTRVRRATRPQMRLTLARSRPSSKMTISLQATFLERASASWSHRTSPKNNYKNKKSRTLERGPRNGSRDEADNRMGSTTKTWPKSTRTLLETSHRSSKRKYRKEVKPTILKISTARVEPPMDRAKMARISILKIVTSSPWTNSL